jgi:hypothetical protein
VLGGEGEENGELEYNFVYLIETPLFFINPIFK